MESMSGICKPSRVLAGCTCLILVDSNMRESVSWVLRHPLPWVPAVLTCNSKFTHLLDTCQKLSIRIIVAALHGGAPILRHISFWWIIVRTRKSQSWLIRIGSVSPVGNFLLLARGIGHMRKTPNLVATGLAPQAASRARPRTRRVSAGSMTPSSQSRALANSGLPSWSYLRSVRMHVSRNASGGTMHKATCVISGETMLAHC
jgi:hypothetical protein